LDPYAVLGVPEGASTEDVRRAYLRLARVHHPDFFIDAAAEERDAAEQRMRSINEAWAILSDPDRRRAFDRDEPRPFRPFDDTADDFDPRDVPDVPYRPSPPASTVERTLTLAPVLLFSASIVVGAVGVFMRLTVVFVLAFALFLLSCVGFIVVPLLALSRARRDEG
jgi:curved DNA-binding protein CbpA